MSWYDKMVAAGRSKSLTTGNVRCGVARWQQFTRYWGALPWRHRCTVTPSLWRIRCRTSSQCSSEWSRCVKPRSNFPVLLTTRAVAFSKRCNLSVTVSDGSWQCPCFMRKQFSRDQCCRGRSKHGCRIVGSHTIDLVESFFPHPREIYASR